MSGDDGRPGWITWNLPPVTIPEDEPCRFCGESPPNVTKVGPFKAHMCNPTKKAPEDA